MEYSNSYLTDFSTERPDGLIETTFDGVAQLYELHEYDIVPVSVGAIVGISFGAVGVCLLIICLIGLIC